MTVVTARRFPIHRFAARNRWQPADQRIKYVTVAAIALNSRSPRPTRVSPLTVSGLAHPGSGGSLLHSFVLPKRQRLCRYDKPRSTISNAFRWVGMLGYFFDDEADSITVGRGTMTRGQEGGWPGSAEVLGGRQSLSVLR